MGLKGSPVRKPSSRRQNGERLDKSASSGREISTRRIRPRVESSAPDVDLTLKHFHRRSEGSPAASEGKRLFLRVVDEVNHLRYEEWGLGVVLEVMTSSIPGGTCLARVRFQDGQLRCFNNDLDNEACCYYFGVRRYWNPSRGAAAASAKFFLRG